MLPFHVRYSGDLLNEQGEPVGALLTESLLATGYITYDFLHDIAPQPGDAGYWERLYDLEITPEHVCSADALVIVRPYVRATAFSGGAERLLAIGRAGVGTDKIDLAACTQHGVVVFNAPTGLIHSTASATLLLMLALAKRLPEQQRLAASGCWKAQADTVGDDLPGQTLGIIGLGRIAEELIRLATPFNMRVLAYSPSRTPEEASALGVTLVSSMDDVLLQADYLCLLGKLTARTHGMIGERELRLMKPSAYFINTGRGEMVQQDVLVRALRERWIAGAALDVFAHEPLPADDPLQTLDNVILTPHWLSTTHAAARQTFTAMTDGMLRLAHGEIPAYVVNADVLDHQGFRDKLARFAANAPQR